jgi:L,D-peptidoglycan transpeptidase YkuD (ErfK/YbiS/YcfS/YnhG family)
MPWKAAVSTRPQRARVGRALAGRIAGHLAVLALAAGLLFAITPTSDRTPAALPAPLTERLRTKPVVAEQLVTVTAWSAHATVARFERWERIGSVWHRVGKPWRAHVGGGGLTRHPAEGRPATPMGTFTLTQAFGAPANRGVTRLPYLPLRFGAAWGSDPRNKRTYNRYYNCDCGTDLFYRLRHSYFRYGVVIDYNRGPVVPGAGSGFFVHVTDGRPTDGCVGLSARHVRTLLGWLNPAAQPRIKIRVAAL